VGLSLCPNIRGDKVEVQSIASEIHEASKRLSKGSDALFILAKSSAETEQAYRSALGREIVKLKLEGMSVTLIADIARGNTSELKFNRDLAEARYVSGRDSLKAISAQINALQTVVKYVSEV